MNLIVGGTGFVGGHLVEYLFQQGEISKGTFRKGSHLKIMDTNGVQGVEADLSDPLSLHEAMEGADVVYNLASPMPGSDSDFMPANSEGILNLLEVASEANAKAFVQLSTLDVYGFGEREISEFTPPRPANDYQKAKAEAERLLLEFSRRRSSPRVVIVRAAKAFGPRDESLALPLLKMIEAGKVVVPHGELMSYSHPKDVAQAMYRAAMGSSRPGASFLTKSFDCAPEGLVRALVSALGSSAEVKRPRMLSTSPLAKYTSQQLRASLVISEQQSWKEMGYSPKYDLNGTCEEIASWYKKEPWITESA